jgi:hypothetical protein
MQSVFSGLSCNAGTCQWRERICMHWCTGMRSIIAINSAKWSTFIYGRVLWHFQLFPFIMQLQIFGPPCCFRCRPTSQVAKARSQLRFRSVEWRWKRVISIWNYVSISYTTLNSNDFRYRGQPSCFRWRLTSEVVELSNPEICMNSIWIEIYQLYNSSYNHFRFSGLLWCFRSLLRASEVKIIEQLVFKRKS